ncbi:MAG TPA: hypothetical protein VIF60_08850 [Burkholderiaceae bacterium]
MHHAVARLLAVSSIALMTVVYSGQVEAQIKQPDNVALTPIQKKQVDEFADKYEKACLNPTGIPISPSKMINTVISWSVDPAVCGCVGQRLRNAITPTVLAYNKEQSDQFMKHFGEVDAMECAVPVIKVRFMESCESLIGEAFNEMTKENAAKRLKELGYTDANTMLHERCGCMRTALREITPQQWVSSSLTKYHEYQERKRTGQATANPAGTPLDDAMATCMKPPKP